MFTDYRRCAAAASALGTMGDVAAAPALLAAFERLAPKDTYKAGAFAGALAALRYKPALPVLLRFTRTIAADKDKYHLYIAWITAMSEFGDRSAKTVLWEIADYAINKNNYGLANQIIREMAGIADDSDLPRLLLLLEDERATEAPAVIAKLGGTQVAPRLLDALLSNNEEFAMKLAIARALGELTAPDIVEEIIRAVGDHMINWQIRWFASEVLDSYPRQECEPKLTHLLSLPGLDKRVRVGVACALANWGNASGLACLLSAFDNNIYGYTAKVADRLSAGWGRPGERVARALLRLGDRTIVPLLMDRYKRARNPRRKFAEIKYDMGEALAVFKALDSIPCLIEVVGSFEPFGSLFLSEALTGEALPVLYDAIDSGKIKIHEYMILSRIADIADTPADAARLFQFFLREPSEYGKDSLYDALEKVSRRAKVRIYGDGRVISVDA